MSTVETWMNLLLPARSFGKIILTTSAGIMDHEEARRKHVSDMQYLHWICFLTRCADWWEDPGVCLLGKDGWMHSMTIDEGNFMLLARKVLLCGRGS